MKKRGKRGPLTAKQIAWYSSPRLKEIGRRGIAKINAEAHLRPSCGARRRTDGEPCQNHPMKNGRCRLHGGATPSGDDWHRTKWPDGKSPAAEKKLRSKLKTLDIRRRDRAKRLASMTPEERARHEKRRGELKPGRVGERQMRRKLKADAAYLASLRDRPERPPSPEAVRLQNEIAELDAAAARLRAEIAAARTETDMGVFG